MGSKSRIAKYIVPIIQKYIDDNNVKIYWEPFVGGANVIDKIKCDKKIGTDINKYLIELLKHVQNGNKLYDSVPKDLYNKARTAFYKKDTTGFEDWQIGNIGFVASYNGRWFDGGYAKSGYEKTKNGLRYRDYYREAKDNILTQASKLNGITFFTSDYVHLKPNDCVVYCDPPYQNTKQYANSIKFDYDKFWNVIRKWSKNNIVLISEQNAPNDFECIWQQEVIRSIKTTDKKKSVEKLFKYKS